VTLMRKMALPAAFAVMCSIVAALADPAGLYFVSGYNPDQTTYFGDVAVTRMDQTYRVVWNVNNQQLSGFGLGYNNSFVANCCGNNQTSLSVMEFQDGVWLGLWWDYSGARLGGEVWQAHDTPDQPTPDGPPNDLAGHYLKAGTQPDGSTYSGEVIVQRDGVKYKILSVTAGSTDRHIGVGIAFKNSLAVDFDNGGTFAVFTREGSGQLGVWAVYNTQKLGTERWARAN
jgi:hypothetical protein